MDFKNETVSNECTPQMSTSSKMTVQQAQTELVRAEQQLANADLSETRAYQAMGAVEQSLFQARYVKKDAEDWRNHCREVLTKAVRGSVIALCLLLPRFAQAQTITIPVTVPPPTPLTVVVPQGTKVVSNGVTYVVTGTLTLTPVVTIGELPPNWPLPTIEQFLLGDKAIETASLGDELILKGNSFGDEMGVLVIGNDIVPVASWADAEIHVVLDPALVTPAPNGSFVTLRRGTDHERGWRDGPVILPKAG
jgi:hypothetical protein